MKKQFIITGILLFSITLFGQEVIAHWDFSKGKIDSADGKFKMNFRGNTKIAGPEGKQYLDVGITSKETPEGIISQKNYPELTPDGAFRLEIKARLREQTGTKPYLILWDTHYSMNPKSSDPKRKKGLIFYLVRSKDGKLRPAAAFGFGDSLDFVYGNPVELEEDKDFTLAVEYDGVKKVSFFLDGKLNRATAVKKGGPLAKAAYPLIIGDRYRSGFNRFDGQILEVKLTALPSPEK
jgi:hypothetical protein